VASHILLLTTPPSCAETLLDEGVTFVKHARAEGVAVEHVVAVSLANYGSIAETTKLTRLSFMIQEGHPHDWVAMPWFSPGTKRLFLRLGDWVGAVHSSGKA
jgi:hypothetical protein